MNKIQKIYVTIIICTSLCLCYMALSNYMKHQNVKVEVGKSYLFSFCFNNKDPFYETKIDTVQVIGIKDDYVQWKYKDGIKISGKLNYFKSWIKPIEK